MKKLTQHIRMSLCLLSWLLLAHAMLGQTTPPHAACDAEQSFKTAGDLLKSKQYEAAARTLTEVQSCPNLTPIQRFNLGWLYGRAHDSRSALKNFQLVPGDVPDRGTHQYAIALSEFELENYRGTVDALKGLRSEGLLDARGTNLLGVAYSKLGQYQDAYPILKEELQQNPNDLFAYLNLVTLLADSGNFKDAAEVANQAVAAFPQNPEVLVVRGASNVLLGNMEASHKDFVAAVQLSPLQPDAQFLLALSDYKQDKFEEAIAEIKAAIAAGIADSDLHYLLAECMLKIDPTKTTAAMTELDRAIELDSRSVSARTLRGKLLLEGGKPRQAVDDLELAHKVDPTSRSALYNLARADAALGKADEAKSLFKQMNSQTQDSLGELSDQKVKKALSGQGSQ
jgi:tetratricopeptide (TPR) repeat protein